MPQNPETLARRRVRRGIRLLDAERPGWRVKLHAKLVDHGVLLDLASPDRCVLGLVYANGVYAPYTQGLRDLSIYEHDHDALHGFDAGDGVGYATLNLVWEQELIRLGIVPTTGYVR